MDNTSAMLCKINPEYEHFVVHAHLTHWGHCEHLTMKTDREGLVFLLPHIQCTCSLLWRMFEMHSGVSLLPLNLAAAEHTLSYISYCFFWEERVQLQWKLRIFTACFQQYSIILKQFVLRVAVSLANAFWDCWIAVHQADELEYSLHLSSSLLPHWSLSNVVLDHKSFVVFVCTITPSFLLWLIVTCTAVNNHNTWWFKEIKTTEIVEEMSANTWSLIFLFSTTVYSHRHEWVNVYQPYQIINKNTI